MLFHKGDSSTGTSLSVRKRGFIEIQGVSLCCHPASLQHYPGLRAKTMELGRCLGFWLRKRPDFATCVRRGQVWSPRSPVHHDISSCLSKHKLIMNVMMMLGSQGLDNAMAQQTAQDHPGQACPVSRKPVSSNQGAGFPFSIPAFGLEKNTFFWRNPAQCASDCPWYGWYLASS